MLSPETIPLTSSQSLIERDHAVVAPAVDRYTELVFTRGEGVFLFDPEGRRYNDFAAGIATLAVGHCHPHVVEAIREQAGRLLHTSAHVGYLEPYVQLMEKLRSIAPGRLRQGKGMFLNGGGEAIEAALKMARVTTGRPMVIAFHESFHGRPMGALSVTASKSIYRRKLSPLLNGVYHTPYPSPHSPIGHNGPLALELLEYALKTVVPPEDVAAIIFEPILGEGGYITPPEGFLPGLRELCNRHNFLLIADEVQTGIGRTGHWFAVDHWGVEPDILALGKALGGGLPLGAVLARAAIAEAWGPASHGSTFGGNPLACRAGLATLEVIEAENLLENARRVGELIESRLRSAQEELPAIAAVRGKGLMLGAEICDPRTGALDRDRVHALIESIAAAGVVITKCGESTLRFVPPLNITPAQAAAAVDLVLGQIRI